MDEKAFVGILIDVHVHNGIPKNMCMFIVYTYHLSNYYPICNVLPEISLQTTHKNKGGKSGIPIMNKLFIYCFFDFLGGFINLEFTA